MQTQYKYKQPIILSFNLVLLLLQSINTRAGVPAIIIFGDSTVDSGNNDYILTPTQSNFEPYGRDFDEGKPTGRFSNGRLATDFISEALGLASAIPAFLDPYYNIERQFSAVCFASAGSGFDDFTAVLETAIPLGQQLEYYKQYQEKLRTFQEEAEAQKTIREALHVISLGTNDFVQNYFVVQCPFPSLCDASKYEDFIVGIAEGFIRDIYELGAHKLAFVGLAPFGCLPIVRTKNLGKCIDTYNKVSMDFNAKLKKMLDGIRSELSDMTLVFGDVYDLIDKAIQNPSYYGFEISEKGCCGTGRVEFGHTCNKGVPGTCDDAEKFVFWDAIYPSQKLYRIAAEHLISTNCASIDPTMSLCR